MAIVFSILREAVSAFPKILTIEDLLSGKDSPRYPDMARGSLNFKKAKRKKGKDQPKLFE